MQSFAYDTDELELIWDAASINEAKKKNRDALFMDISLVNNMPKFKIIDHGYNYSKSQFMLQEEGFTLPQGNSSYKNFISFDSCVISGLKTGLTLTIHLN